MYVTFIWKLVEKISRAANFQQTSKKSEQINFKRQTRKNVNVVFLWQFHVFNPM